MDRLINYPGQVPLETDLLTTNRNVLVGLGLLCQDLFGTTTQVSGFTCVPTAPASLSVQVTPGRLYSFQNLDSTAYSSLAADTTHQILKQGVLLDAVTLACPAPATAGYSIAYLIQATYQDTDASSVTLPYYNASNPTQAYSGPNNTGTSQPTARKGVAAVTVKAGIPAATGSQLTPAPDAGYVGMFVVTVAQGAASIGSANISQYSGIPLLSIGLDKLLFDVTASYVTGSLAARAALTPFVTDRPWNGVADYNGASGTDNTAAIQAGNDAVEGRGGSTLNLSGRFKTTATVNALKSMGSRIAGTGGGRTFGTEIHNASTTGAHAIHVGDPTESSVDGAHLNGVSIERLAITGNSDSGNGIQAYNAALYTTDVYIPSHGGWGTRINKGWGSKFELTTWQIDVGGGFKSDNALNAVHFLQCDFLSETTATSGTGCEITAGPDGTASVLWTVPDFEGNKVALHLDATGGALKNVVLVCPHFEGNYEWGILQDGTGNLTGGAIIGGSWYGAGNGMSFANVYAFTMVSPTISDCGLSVSNNGGLVVFNPRIEGSATITGAYVIAPLALSTTIVPDRAFYHAASDRNPVQSQIAGTVVPYEPVMAGTVTSAAAGAVAVQVDLSKCNVFYIFLTGAATSLTVTAINDSSPIGGDVTICVQNTGTGTGAITWPAGWKAFSGGSSLPSTSHGSTFTWHKDPNGVRWPKTSALNAG